MRAARELGRRLTEALGLDVHVLLLEEAERAPLVLEDILDEGIVLVDRSRRWPALKAQEDEIRARAAKERQELHRAAAEAIRRMSEDP